MEVDEPIIELPIIDHNKHTMETPAVDSIRAAVPSPAQITIDISENVQKPVGEQFCWNNVRWILHK